MSENYPIFVLLHGRYGIAQYVFEVPSAASAE